MFKLDRIYRTEGFGPLPAFSRCMQRNCLRPGSPLTSLQRAKTAIRCETGVASQKKRQSAARIDKTPPLPVKFAYLYFTSSAYCTQPTELQQTIARSFTLGGIGLHSGEYAFVCVRPAFAGEGRYFVHVPAGTNAHKFNLIDPESVDPSQLDVRAGAVDNLSDDARAQLYLQFRKDEESGQFEGSFGDYVKHKVGDPGDTFFLDVDSLGEVEDPVTRDTDEVFVPAAIENAEGRGNMATVLTSSNRSVEISSVEALLAALEQCGVDNARIEIESASVLDSSVNTVDVSSSVQVEVPIIDGSSLGWALEVQKVGLQQAQWQQHDEEGMSRVAPAPAEMLSVQDGESFVTFYPGSVPRVTAGIDEHAEASVIGRQWYSWTPCNESEVDAQDLHYRWELAAGRLTMTLPAAQKLLSEGMLRGGPDFCCLVADGDSWLDPSLERFPGEDAARSAANILLGNLSLLASPGGRGLPQGHVVAYRAGTELQLKFAKALAAHSKEWGMAEVKE